ncbi:BRCT domain-containing protein [Vibrio bivalvicida]|uniref:BRCT domain-containing protein n=1 Tax=Vibrio bivalvicida TaxID=1276888 RepID=UPI00192CE52F|nr:BRCT domain-containing protein [Vibrio bivalvicida]
MNHYIKSFQILGVGDKYSKNISNHFSTLEKFANAEYIELASAPVSLPSKAMKGVQDFLAKVENQKMLIELESTLMRLGVHWSQVLPNTTSTEEVDDGKFYGKTAVLTGTFIKMKRSEIKSLLEEKGVKVSGSVSKNTDFLIAGEKAGSKLAKATSLGVDIWDEDKLWSEIDEF